MDSVHIAVVSHRHGMNVYAATTKYRLEKQVADYCRDWWIQVLGKDKKIPNKDSEVIDVYFEEACNHSYHGEHLEVVDKIPVD